MVSQWKRNLFLAFLYVLSLKIFKITKSIFLFGKGHIIKIISYMR